LRGRESSPNHTHAVRPFLTGITGEEQREKHVGALKGDAGEGRGRAC